MHHKVLSALAGLKGVGPSRGLEIIKVLGIGALDRGLPGFGVRTCGTYTSFFD